VRACLSDDKVAPILRKHFVIVCDSSNYNKTSFGVMAFANDADRKEVHKYFIGTGNAQIGRKFVQAAHDEKVAAAEKFLKETVKRWEESKAK
jgi:hypothetical protein